MLPDPLAAFLPSAPITPPPPPPPLLKTWIRTWWRSVLLTEKPDYQEITICHNHITLYRGWYWNHNFISDRHWSYICISNYHTITTTTTWCLDKIHIRSFSLYNIIFGFRSICQVLCWCDNNNNLNTVHIRYNNL
jgi:hypothetical protein